MKTGIELIAIERQEQIEKHGYTEELTRKNPHWYNAHQLSRVASLLTHSEDFSTSSKMHPMEMAIDIGLIQHWDKEKLCYMASKPYKERLIISAALLAAEIDRLNFQEEVNKNSGKKFNVMLGVFFGGNSIVGKNLTYQEALDLEKTLSTDVYESVWIEEIKTTRE